MTPRIAVDAQAAMIATERTADVSHDAAAAIRRPLGVTP